ncbi:hypothetical protein BLNAU_4572 [Blattamonas nauphoetae]|uniref:Uncharacterized protein n=1 Tax=Blattamonas nauphoetae TaxID=2049346 RepID=A0ABQ9Y9C7_9EUKA|nr:hypothetical protein BLNAU_4572 [Blattamonas nauphoetae]
MCHRLPVHLAEKMPERLQTTTEDTCQRKSGGCRNRKRSLKGKLKTTMAQMMMWMECCWMMTATRRKRRKRKKSMKMTEWRLMRVKAKKFRNQRKRARRRSRRRRNSTILGRKSSQE